MHRLVLASALLLAGTAATAAPKSVVPRSATANWAQAISGTPQGGILIGNPKAAHRLVEFGSLTCSHCRDFHLKGLPELKAKYIASGKLSYEFRSFARNGPDFAGSLLAACQAPRAAHGFIDALFREQDAWTLPFTQISEADSAGVAALPVEQQFARVATLGKLDSWAAGHGLPLATGKACLADKKAMDLLVTNRNQAVQVHGLKGTPTFVLDGKTVDDAYDWTALEPKLQAAMK